MNIPECVNKYLEDRASDQRYASFDYCYNYFYSFYRQNKINELVNEENLQLSCLHLGFYLASWGMFRGSSHLLSKSMKYFKKLIETIAEMDRELWEIDIDNYTEKNIDKLLDCKKKIIGALSEENWPSPSGTLATKIMLGVFANIPAFDQNFRKSLRVNSVNKRSLLIIKKFYEENKQTFNDFKICTLDFLSSKETDIKYTKAKLIDMYGFTKGMGQK